MIALRIPIVGSIVLGILCASVGANADPQGNAGLTLGVAGVGESGAIGDHAEFHLGARGDILFARDQPSDFGLGPYAEIGTLGFDELHVGGGLSALLPVHPTFPIVLSGGAYGRYGDDGFGFEPGIAGSLFWGTRSYNFHTDYVMAAGLLVSYRASMGDSGQSALVVGAQLDAVVLSLPFVMLFDLIRGPSDEARASD